MFQRSCRNVGFVACLALASAGCSGANDAGSGADGGLSKLPVPAGVKSMYADANTAMYVTDASVEATAAECKKLLLADGWVPYGEAGPTQFFKRDLHQLTAMISSAPAQGDKTVIQFTQVVMQADLPPPPDATRIHYADSIKRLDFDSSAPSADLYAKYGETLRKAGWEPTTEKPVVDGPQWFQIFRNAQQDMLTLETRDVTDVRRGHLEHRTAAEVEEIERKFKEEQARLKQEAEAKKPN